MIIWLASYPKSGNTWVRAFISTCLVGNSQKIFNNIGKIRSFPKKKEFFGIVDEKVLRKDHMKLFEYFISAQAKINENNKLNIMKTHNAWCSVKGFGFSNEKNTLGSIYIIRDPRSVAVSYAYHANISFEESVSIILKENYIGLNEKFYPEARLSWNHHVSTWTNNPLPKLIIRYEDLHKNQFKYFRSIVTFINKFLNNKIELSDDEIEEIINSCSFENLSKIEKEIGFIERAGERNFFRKGNVDEWQKCLPAKMIKKIETNCNDLMKKLNYL